MNLLSLEKINKVYGEKTILNDVDFFLNEGEKVGVIGINGTGKSTLLKIAAGIEEPDSGTRTASGNAVIRYLGQNPVFAPGETVLEYVLKEAPKDERWTYEAQAKSLLNRFGITDHSAECALLSGGQKKRTALAAVLLLPGDILILDEPTNHLDAQMCTWLEKFLRDWKKELIMVTHDRYFLDAVTTRITEIHQGNLYSYDGNFGDYLEKKAEREELEDSAARKRRNILRTELEWLRRGARARSTKQKAHIDRIEKLQNVRDAVRDGNVVLSSVSSRMGKTTIELEHISETIEGRCLIRDFSYIFLKNDRIGIIGPNGCGKTTLMKIISGNLQADSGERIAGQTVKIGYYTQEIDNDPSAGLSYMNPSKRVIDYIRDTAEYVVTDEGSVTASVMLDRFLFPPAMQYTPIEKLSGGEKRRLYLLRILMEAPNFLLLDEPANDLDIQTLAILEDYINSFNGIVVTVSHDRYYLDRMVNRIFAFRQDGTLRQFEGGYSDYEAVCALEEQTAEQKSSASKKTQTEDTRRRSPRKLKFSYREQKDYETIENDIAVLEKEIEELDKKAEGCATDFVKLNQYMTEKTQKEEQLEEKMERWMYLEELAARIEAGEYEDA